MIKNLIDRLRGRTHSRRPVLKLIMTPRDQHPISRKDISSAAVKTLYRLHDNGYQAFLVGGGVRDLLLGLNP